MAVTFPQLWNHKTAIFRLAEPRFTAVVICEGVADQNQHGRGVALADFNGDGRTDIVYGNWNGPHRLFLQGSNSAFRVRTSQQSLWKGFEKVTPNARSPLQNIATAGFATPSPVRTVIAADFDNDKELEVFFNNIFYRQSAPNRVFR